MSLALTAEKLLKVKSQCTLMLNNNQTTILDLTKLVGLLSSTCQAVMPAIIQLRFLQNLQIQSLKRSNSYMKIVEVSHLAQKELIWWIKNLELQNGRLIIPPRSQVLLQTDASKKVWGEFCQGLRTGGGSIVQGRAKSPHQCPGTASNKVCNPLCVQNKKSAFFSYSGRQPGSSILPLKKGRNCISKDDQSSKVDLGISVFQSDHNYCRIPPRNTEHRSRLGVSEQSGFFRVDVESKDIQTPNLKVREPNNRSVCIKNDKTNSKVFFLETRPLCQSSECNATGVAKSGDPLHLSPFLIDKQSAKESDTRSNININNYHTNTANSTLVSPTVEFIQRKSDFITPGQKSLAGSNVKSTSLIKNRTLSLEAWAVSGKVWHCREYQKQLQTLLFHREGIVQMQITHRPGISRLLGVVSDRLIPFDVM